MMPIATESIRQQRPGALRGSMEALLVQRWLGPAAALGGLLLTLPALGVGWVADDYYQRWVLRQSPVYAGVRPPPADMFRFLDGDPQRTERLKEIGLVPWWTSPTMRVAFWRPLTVLTHVVDHTLWPGRPAIMHAHSLLWFGLLLLSVSLLYRQILGKTVAAGWAIVLYAVDYSHAIPAAWLANRNSVLAALFGVLAIYAHDQWRRCGHRLAAVLGPLLLAMGLLCAEAGIATVAYVLAYALTLDRSTWRGRVSTILPYVLVVFLWRTVWSWQGCGVAEFDYVYLDPAADPLRFCGMVFLRAPILLLSQWAMPPAEAHVVLGPHGAVWVCLAGVAVLLPLVFLFSSLLRSTAAARFWAVGMLLATIPCCATIPLTRHLMFISIGAMGLLGQYLAMALGGDLWRNVSLLRRFVQGMLVGLLLLVHLLLAPLGLLLLSRYPVGPSQFLASLHAIPCMTSPHGSRDLIIVNHPLPVVVLYMLTARAVEGQPMPRGTRVLAPAFSSLTVRRPAVNALLLRPSSGYFASLSSCYSSAQSMAPGDSVELPGMTVTVLKVTEEGRPTDVLFRFPVALEDRSLHWVCWESGRFREFRPPGVGAEIELPGSGLPF